MKMVEEKLNSLPEGKNLIEIAEEKLNSLPEQETEKEENSYIDVNKGIVAEKAEHVLFETIRKKGNIAIEKEHDFLEEPLYAGHSYTDMHKIYITSPEEFFDKLGLLTMEYTEENLQKFGFSKSEVQKILEQGHNLSEEDQERLKRNFVGTSNPEEFFQKVLKDVEFSNRYYIAKLIVTEKLTAADMITSELNSKWESRFRYMSRFEKHSYWIPAEEIVKYIDFDEKKYLRRNEEEKELRKRVDELKASILRTGMLLQPPLLLRMEVADDEDNKYCIVIGEARTRAICELYLEGKGVDCKLGANIFDEKKFWHDENFMEAAAIEENTIRKNLTKQEIIIGIQRALKQNLSHKKIATRFKVSVDYVKQISASKNIMKYIPEEKLGKEIGAGKLKELYLLSKKIEHLPEDEIDKIMFEAVEKNREELREMRKFYTPIEEPKELKSMPKLNYVEKNGEKRCIYCIGKKKIEVTDEEKIRKIKAIEEEIARIFEDRINFVLRE
jgi:hypothetical protein